MKHVKRVRQEGSKKGVNNQRKSGPVLRASEYAGNRIKNNRWFKIGLSPLEIEALKAVQERLWMKPEQHSLAATARLLIEAALAHYDSVAPLALADAAYCLNEGFPFAEEYFERMICARFKLDPGLRKQVKGGVR